MKKTKTARCLILTAIALLTAFSAPSAANAAAQTVDVSLTEFNVTLNDWVYDGSGTGSRERYPFIVYRGITYFPMTFNKASLLNIKASWTEKDGLSVDLDDFGKWKEVAFIDGEPMYTSKRQKAILVTGKVTVNGKRIDNVNEPYPLLLFREITYFPLTWRFAVDEFGWSYQFDAKTGLNIKANNSFFEQTNSTYVNGGVKVQISLGGGLTALADSMTVERGGEIVKVNGAYGYQKGGVPYPYEPLFKVEDKWVYTTVTPSKAPFGETVPCRINIETLEVEMLD